MKKLIFIFFIITFLWSCEKINTRHNINDLPLNRVQKTIITPDDGLLIAGVYDSKLNFIKTDANFNIEWIKDDYEWGIFKMGSWGGPSGYAFEVINLFQDNNDNLFCIGSVTEGSCVITQSCLIIELNRDGEEINKMEMPYYTVRRAVKTPDNGYLLTGYRDIRKLDKNFNVIWNLEYPFGEPFIGEVINTWEGSFAMTAYDDSNGRMSIKIVESDGSESMTKEFAYNDINHEERGFDLIELENGGFIIAGRSRTHDEPWDMDCGIARLTASGEKIWSQSLGTPSDEWFDEVIYYDGNEIIVQGSVGYPADTVQKTILYKYNLDGEIVNSLTTDRIGPLLYHPNGYFIKYQQEEEDCIHFEKIPLNDLFD